MCTSRRRRGGVLKIPPTHPVYDCARPRWRRYAMCSVHAEQWQEAEVRGMSRAQFLRAAEPLPATEMPEAMMWETIIVTGRRASEVIQLRLDCVGRYDGLLLLWHDQTKVGNLNAAVRIPDHLLHRLEERRQKTLTHYADRHAGRPPTAAERARLALFPTDILNPDGRRALSYTWFHTGFRAWLTELDLGGHYVAHQAPGTLWPPGCCGTARA
ncbi:hypothetical protein ACFW4M_36050 [Streptomyces sp. NPDC058794]|uniref:hypothetical protein n=1 Tax=Streptomyces sp. NPDC058794 TaxID=3346636 RepID=UPI0036A8F8FD